MIRDIAGRQNHSVKLARKLQQKKYRRDRGLLICEGMDLLMAAIEAGAEIRDVLVRRDLASGLPAALVDRARVSGDSGAGPDIGICDGETLAYASALGGAADVVFTSVQPESSLGDLALHTGITFFLDGLGDPGNVGTLARTMLAFGGLGILCSPRNADPFSPKAMRAGMGAQFTLPVVIDVTPADLSARLEVLKMKGEAVPEVWIADPHGGEDLMKIAPEGGCVVVLGAERTGPGVDWQKARRVTVPQARAESLNVAMAGTVFAYEYWRNWRNRADSK